jgi:hypothetical protein
MSVHNYVRAGHAGGGAADTCAWTVIDVPGFGHAGKGMSATAAPLVSAAMRA